MQLNEASAASRTSRASSGCATAASVATKPSMVAMFGRIMPAPLAMPVTVTAVPPRLTFREAALGTVSVVMMASAAAAQLSSRRSAMQAGRPASRRSTGSGSMMTPVENGSTCQGEQPSSRATASQLARAACRPGSPVPALAMPVFTTRARMPPACGAAARCSRQTQHRRGAEAVLGEHAGDGGACVEADQQQVAAVGLADAGLGDAEGDAGHGGQAGGGGRAQIDGHGNGCLGP